MKPLRVIAALAAALLLASAVAAQPLHIEAYATPADPAVHDVVVFTIEVRGSFSEVGTVQLPGISNFVLLSSAPSRQTRVYVRNGQATSEVQLQWRLQPIRAGRAVIGPAELRVDGRRHRTDPVALRIRDTPSAARPAPAEPTDGPRDVFLRAVADRSTAYVGQQVMVEYVLYYSADVQARNARAAAAWDASGLWREDMDVETPIYTRDIVIDGRRFHAATIRRAAFFPARSGHLEISPLEIELDVLRAGRVGGVPYNVFGHRFRRERFSAPAVPLEVLPLPDGAPDDFSGAVGAYEMAVEVRGGRATSGDPLRVHVRLSGDGNPATADHPVWSLPPGAEAYPPRTSTTVDRRGDRLVSTRAYTFTAEVHSRSLTELPAPTWTYFDPGARTYRTLTGEPLPLDVLLAPDSESERATVAEMPALRTAVAEWQPRLQLVPPHRRAGTAAGILLPLLVLLGVAAARRRRDRADRAPAGTGAASRARHALDRLERSPDVDSRRTARGVDRALRQFLAERLGLPSGAHTLDELEDVLREHGIDEPARSSCVDVLRACEALQFGPGPEDAVDVSDVRRLVAALDEVAPPT